jgi:conjugal transfer/type IV secretion protein DotA/TraY
MKRTSPVLLVALLALLASGAAFGQSDDLARYFNATPATDFSMRLWESVLGAFARSPFSPSGVTTLLGKMFIVLNGAIFAVGTAWLVYGILSAMANTAQDGEAMGKRMNALWYPIRAVTGIAGMSPVLGGFTLSQGLLMWIATLGIGIANAMFNEAVSSPQLTQVVGTAAITGAPNVRASQINDVARAMLRSNICLLVTRRHEDMLGAPVEYGGGGPALALAPQLLVSTRSQALDDGLAIKYGSDADPEACGSVSVRMERFRGSDSATAFRVQSVDYAGIRNAVSVGVAERLLALDGKLAAIAKDYMAASDAAVHVDRGLDAMKQFDIDPKPIDEAAASYFNEIRTLTSGAVGNKMGSITASAQARMRELGWIGAGAWFSTFAEANAALADAVSGIKFKATSEQGLKPEDVAEAMERVDGVLSRAAALKAGGVSDPTAEAIDGVLKDTCVDFPSASGLMGTATGNCSFGQAIVSAFIGATARGSGGGSAGSGSLIATADQAGLTNPVLASKNLGDYVMTVASSLITQSFLGEKIAAGAAWAAGTVGKWVGTAGTVAGVPGAGGLAAGGDVLAKVGGFAGAALGYAVPFGWMLLVLGGLMAVYIPMVPFISWFGGLIAYAASFIEGLIAMPLHSLAHLQTEGEGLGSGTTKGYLFFLNTLVRPALMVLSFFIASSLVIALGTLLAHLFLPAMASVQGNSITGLASIVALLVVFFLLNMILINSCFELVQVIPDQVIGFVGAGDINTHLGKATEGKVNQLFMLASRSGNESLKASALAGAKPRKKS